MAPSFLTAGQIPPVENLGSPAPVFVLCRLTSSRCRLRFVHRSFTFRRRSQSFRENKKPCLHLGKQGLEKFYGSSLTCLPPGYPNSFRELALYTTWIGQSSTHNPGLTGYDVSLARPTLSAKSWLICSCRFSSNVKTCNTENGYSQILISITSKRYVEAHTELVLLKPPRPSVFSFALSLSNEELAS